ncbi:MAG TPA: endonuclease domain-containing protein, partial [Candidatus Peribacteria bacterium]|nr:endonuclease domain-containing protein [Candidatus Peribacteria bacterium]
DWMLHDAEYFSLLRPLTELHVTKLFAQYPQYFTSFTSCNKNWKISGDGPESRWCGDCPKCAFVFALLAAHVDRKTLDVIFDKNMFDEHELLPLYRQLLGIEGTKPFECVGTPEETVAAFLMAHERGDLDDTAAMQLFLKSSVFKAIKKPKPLIAKQFELGTRHLVPPQYLSLLPR